MNKTPEFISFAKERDFGQTLNATFRFFGQEFKGLFTALATYVMPFVVLAALLASYLDLSNTFRGYRNRALEMIISNDVTMKSPVLILLLFIFMVLLYDTVYSYCALYHEKGRGNFTNREVGERILYNLGKFFFTFLLFFIAVIVITVVIIGFIAATASVGTVFLAVIFLLCFYAYMFVTFFSIFCVQLIEGENVLSSISRCLAVIKNHWWRTFGVLFILGLIIGLMSSFAQAILNLIAGIFTINSFDRLPRDPDALSSFATASVVIRYTANLFFQPLMIIASVFHYFSLVEKKEKTGLLAEIENIGRKEPEHNPYGGEEEHY